MKPIPAARLRRLRNEIPIADLIRSYLDMPSRHREGFLRFLCPLCSEFNTATNPKTNLARCFRCSVNFNPIDMVMAVERCRFMEAVEVLSPLLETGVRVPPDDRGDAPKEEEVK